MNEPSAAKVVDLAQASPPRLFFALLRQRFTGTMELEQANPAGARTVWFAGGMPVYTDWLGATDVLGQVLVELRYVDDAALVSALESMAKGAGLLGEVLLAQGHLTPEQLAEGLRQQCTRKLIALFGIREGRATLTAGDHPLTEMEKVNVLELMLTAVGKHYDADRVRSELGQALDAPLRSTSAYERYQSHFRFRPTDQPLLDALHGGSTLAELATLSDGGERRAAQLIYVLWASQMLRAGAAAQSVQATPTPQQPAQRAATASQPPAPVRSQPAKPAAVASPPAAAPSPAPPPVAASTAKASPPAAAQPPENAGPKTGGGSGANEAEFVAELTELEEKIEAGAHAFDLLGVELGAGKRDVRGAWSALSRKMHPDILASLGWSHLRERVGDVFAALSEAHTTLSDKTQREQLRIAIESGVDTTASQDATALARAAFESELIAKEGDRFLKANHFGRALEKFVAALELTPEEPDLLAATIWCRYCTSPQSADDAKSAEQQLGEIVTSTPNLARAHYFRGMVLKDLGANDAAAISFARALQIDSRLIDAERQMRVIKAAKRQQSKDSGKEKRGGLRGLFGKR